MRMEIPVRVANELWRDYPDVLKAFTLWEEVHCDMGWDDKGNLILTPISLSNHNAGRGCTIAALAPIRVSLIAYDICETETNDHKTGTDDKYDRWMQECLHRARRILSTLAEGEAIYSYPYPADVFSIAIALFQAKVGQIVTVKNDTGPTGVQG